MPPLVFACHLSANIYRYQMKGRLGFNKRALNWKTFSFTFSEHRTQVMITRDRTA